MTAKKTGACCGDFVRLHSNIGRRGFSIRTEAQAKPTLTYNAVPPHEEAGLAEALKSTKLVVQSVGRETIRHCPFCGAQLGT